MILRILSALVLLLEISIGHSASEAELAVWVNEAIIATYTYNYQTFIAQQQNIAKYFSSEGWISYSGALNQSGLPDTVQKNKYYVSAVATLPPTIKPMPNQRFEADMPILVLYKNPQYQQKQNLSVHLIFANAPKGQGVRGLAILSLQTKVISPPCECVPNTSGSTQ